MRPQGGGPPAAQNPFAYNVNTEYTPNQYDEVVPAVPQPGPGHGFGPQAGRPGGPPPPGQQGPPRQGPPQQGAWGAPQQQQGHPGFGPPQQAPLAFTDTTAPQFVSGNISKQEERQHLVAPGEAGSSQPFVAPTQQQGAGGERATKEDYTKYPFYNVRRYREHFDVDSKDVLWRVFNSLIGVFRPNFMEVTMKRPDLYGPFWVATTLIFITAVAGNLVSYLNWRHTRPTSPPPAYSPAPGMSPVPAPTPGSSSDTTDNWFTDYTKLGTSAAIFYGYITVVGLGLFFCIKWFKGELKLVNIFCIYGYCMSIYIPVSIACIVPISWLQWTLVMGATALSAGFLIMNVRATVYQAAPARTILILLIVLLLHIGLGLALKLYFFSY